MTINLGVEFTIFDVEELANDENISIKLTRDLESDWIHDFCDFFMSWNPDVTVTF